MFNCIGLNSYSNGVLGSALQWGLHGLGAVVGKIREIAQNERLGSYLMAKVSKPINAEYVGYMQKQMPFIYTEQAEFLNETVRGLHFMKDKLPSREKGFLKSKVAALLYRGTKVYCIEYAGYKVGQVFPALSLGTFVGKKVANRFSSQKKERRIAPLTDKSREWKWIFFGTTIVVTKLAHLIFSKFAETYGQDRSSDAFLAQTLCSVAGSIIGGMLSLELSGHDPGKGYIQRGLQYYAGAQTVRFVGCLMPNMPPAVAGVSAVVQKVFESVGGSCGMRAESLIMAIDFIRHAKLGNSHQKLLVGILGLCHPQGVRGICEKIGALSVGKKGALDEGLLILGLIGKKVQRKIEGLIHRRIPANFVVRTFNEYAEAIQAPQVQQALMHLLRATNGEKEQFAAALDGAIRDQLRKNYSKYALMPFAAGVVEPKIGPHIDKAIDQFLKMEKELFGISITYLREPNYRDAVKLLATLYASYAIKRMFYKDAKTDLTISDEQMFYSNICGMLFNPIKMPQNMKQLAAAGVQKAIEVLPIESNSPPRVVKKSFLQSLIDRIKAMFEKFISLFRSCYSADDDDDIKRIPLIIGHRGLLGS